MKNKSLVILLAIFFINALYAEVLDISTSSINTNTVKYLSLDTTLSIKMDFPVHSMLTIDKNLVFVPDDYEFVVLDVSDLKTLWKVNFESKGLSGGSRSKPLIVGNFILFSHSDLLSTWRGKVFCYTLEGKKVWENNKLSSISGNLFYKDGYIYLADIRNGLYCLSINDGKIIWNNSEVRASNCVIALSEKDIFVVNRKNCLYSIDMKTSEINWQKSFEDYPWIGSIIYNDNKVFLFQQVLYCMDSQNGDILYKTKFAFRSDNKERHWGRIVLIGDDIYLLIGDGTLYCLNKDSGTILWKKVLNTYLAQKIDDIDFNYSGPTIINDLLFVGTNYGFLYAIDKNHGDIVHKFSLGSFPSNPSTQNGKLFCLGRNQLHCLSIKQKIQPFFECNIKGRIFRDRGGTIENMLVFIGDTSTITDNNGFYNVKITTQKGNISIKAINEGYFGKTNIDVFQSGEYVGDINCMFYGD